MTGSTPFLIEKTDKFQRSFKKIKIRGQSLVTVLGNIIEGLINDPYPPKSFQEPLPSKAKLPEGWTFHKLRFKIGEGASGQIRLMYLVNQTTCHIKLLWIYTHDQYPTRPPDPEIEGIIREALEP